MEDKQMDLSPPNTITIGEFIYSLKAELKEEKYSYRCKFRSKCGIIINISKEELIQHEKEKIHNTQKNNK